MIVCCFGSFKKKYKNQRILIRIRPINDVTLLRLLVKRVKNSESLIDNCSVDVDAFKHSRPQKLTFVKLRPSINDVTQWEEVIDFTMTEQ